MTKNEYLNNLVSPTPSLILKAWPGGNIVQGWGEHPELYSHSYRESDALRHAIGGHTGTDIQGPKGTPICAAQEGNVVGVTTSRESVGGIIISIDSLPLDNNGISVIIRTVYAHLDQCLVKQGDWIEKGKVIGYMGNTGMLTGTVQPYWAAPAKDNTHLHFAGYELVDWGRGREPRYKTPLDGSFDIMAFLNRDIAPIQGILARIMKFLGLEKTTPLPKPIIVPDEAVPAPVPPRSMDFKLDFPIYPWKVIQEWGVLNPRYQQYGFSRHHGTDVAHGHDKKTYAPFSGKILKAEFSESGGWFLFLLSDNEYEWPDGKFAKVLMKVLHNEKLLVAVNEKVDRGRALCINGNTGDSDGPHAHLGFFRTNAQGEKLDTNHAAGSFDPKPYYTHNYVHS